MQTFVTKTVLLLLSFFIISLSANAQICGIATDEPPGCLLDSIYYAGQTQTYSNSPLLPTITGAACDVKFQDAWMEIIPICEEIQINFRQVQCIPRFPTYGVGVAVLDENYKVQGTCFVFNVIGFQNQTFNVPGLIPGKRYHLMTFTRVGGQRCTYNFGISGIATYGVDHPGMHGVFNLGVGSISKFYVEVEAGDSFNWTTDPGISIVSGQGEYDVLVNTPTAGSYQICCTITHADGTTDQLCETITVAPTTTTVEFQKALYCKNDCIPFGSECIGAPGQYYDRTGSTLKVLEACQNLEPQAGIYGQPEIQIPGSRAPELIYGYVKRGNGNYSYQWYTQRTGPFNTDNYDIINGATQLQLNVGNSDTYCFAVIDNDTGCGDTTCTEVLVTTPLPERCGVAGDDPPGCAICGPIYSGSTAGYTRGPRPPGFCGTIENNQWLAVQADATTITIDITSFNCAFGRGVQLYMLDVNNNPVSSCFSSGGNNLPGRVTANNLIPGEVYFIMIDGFAGDICDFTITVIGGVNTGPPDPIGVINADADTPCPGQVVCYDVATVRGGAEYLWHVVGDGTILVGQGTNQVCVQWSQPGTSEICVAPSNPCFVGDTICLPVTVANSSAVNNLPPQEFCSYEFPLEEADYCSTGKCPGTIPMAGTYCVSVGASSGTCDSTICYTFVERPIQQEVIDTFICLGNNIDFFGTRIDSGGTYVQQIPVPNQCDRIVEWNVELVDLEAVIENPRPYDCIRGDTMLLEGFNSTSGPRIQYEWTTYDGGVIEDGGDTPFAIIRGPGSYVLKIQFGEGGLACIDRDTVQVIGSLAPPNITCTSTGSSITFTWNAVPGAVNYNVDIDGTAQGITTMTTWTVTGLVPLQPVTIGVQANGVAGCGSAASTLLCQAQDCPQVLVSIDTVPPVCIGTNDQPIQLMGTFQNAVGGGTTLWAGNFLSPTGVFDPSQAGVGSHVVNIIYEEMGCNYFASRRIEIFEPPTNTFEVQTPICVTDESQITYTGNASPNAIFNWNFDNANINGGSGDGPYFLQWNTGGNYTISLDVTENGCTSPTESLPIVVEDLLDKPELRCISTTTSTVEIGWNPIAGSTGFDVQVLAGTSGTRNGNTYLVGGMNPGDSVTLRIAALTNNICGPTLDTITCYANDCPPVQIDFDPIQSICLYPNTADFDLNDFLTLSGNTGAETRTWSGTATSSSGIFSPLTAGVGTFTATLEINDSGCSFDESLTIILLPIPTAAIAVDPLRICEGETTLIEATGSYASNTIFNWDRGNGIEIGTANGAGPYQMQYNNSGTENISLTVETDGCISDPAAATVDIDEPLLPFVINCNTSTSTIEFDWAPVVGATDYQVVVLNAPAGFVQDQPDDFHINITNLQPLDGVTIEVVASDPNSTCPPVRIEKTCEAKNCPPIQLSFGTVDQICLDAGATGTPIDLNDFFTLTGDNGNPTVRWSGSNSVDMNGIFTPSSSDFGTHQVQVEVSEEGCDFSERITINVVEIPSSDFTANSPICQTDISTAQLTQTPLPNAILNWNFGNANATGTPPNGPFDLTWTNAQTDEIYLLAENMGCESDTTFVEIQVDPTVQMPTIDCQSELTQITFSWNDVPGATDYDVTILNAPTGYSSSQPDDLSIIIEDLLPTQTVDIQLVVSNNLSVCPPVTATLSCPTLDCPPMTFTKDPIPDICLSANVDLVDFTPFIDISGQLTNGTWEWKGSAVTSDGIFDANASGIGTHTVTAIYKVLNCEYQETLEVTVHPIPIADAGLDKFISCLDTSTDIGGSQNNTNPSAVTYEWTGGIVDNPAIPNTLTSEIGFFVLNSTNPITGCVNTDTMEVKQGGTAPELFASIQNITCFGYNDGIIRVDSIIGGTPPLYYSLNDQPFTANQNFEQLGPGDYRVRVQDAFGCEDEITFSISEPDELTVELVIIATENPVPFGDSVLMQAVTNYAPEFLANVSWTPVDQFPICDETNIANCLNVFVSPTGQTVYTVRVEHLNGCAASDNGQVLVSKDKGIYIPSAFSPNNNDGLNDKFRVYANLKLIKNVRSFLVFNRWGEMVHESYNFLPEDESHGWDGRYRGKPLNSNVFAWVVEVEYFDGEVVLLKGDVTLTY